MPVSYKREMNHNYMIINTTIQEAGGYECRMLSTNTIEGLLKFRVGHLEDKKEFYYEITSKQPLNRILNQRTITGNEIRSLLLNIAATLGKIEDFLLKEEQIMLEPEYIYVDPDHFKVYLCMVPGYFCDFPAAVSALLGYLIGKVNHQDKEGVVLAYNLYHESLKENYGLPDLLRHLSAKGNSIFDTEETNQIEEVQPVKYNGGTAKYDEELVKHTGESVKHAGESVKHTGESVKYARESGKYMGEPVKYDRNPVNDVKESLMRAAGTTFHNKPKTRKNSSSLAKGIKIILSVAAAEVLLWIFTGIPGLVQYGLFLGGAISLLAVTVAAANSHRAEKTISKNQVQKETWQLAPQEKTDKDWTDWIESDNIGECEKTILPKEPETELLTVKAETSRFALLESLSRDRENITISYVPFVIGKHSEMADYCLRQPTVSRLHLRIDQKEGVYIATDLNSTNGTIVEGYQLQANETVSIKSGDTVYLADIGYRFLNS